jgi:SH3 domain protein
MTLRAVLAFAVLPAVLVTVLLPARQAAADTVYIRDTLYVPLRGGQSPEYRILHRGLRSGTPVERLETNEETGYTRVRIEDGTVGWLQTQYLVEEPIAADLIGNMTSQLEALEATHQQTLLRLREANEIKTTLASDIASLTQENEQLNHELQQIRTLAADVIAIDEENQRMLEDQDSLLVEIQSLNQQNEALTDDSAMQWFMRGAGVVLISLLLGFLLGRRIYTRRNSGGWA